MLELDGLDGSLKGGTCGNAVVYEDDGAVVYVGFGIGTAVGEFSALKFDGFLSRDGIQGFFGDAFGLYERLV